MRKRVGTAVVAVTLGVLASSCVTQEQYEDAQLSAKHYQREWIAQGRRIDELEAENARLRAELEAGDVEIAEAGYQIDERLANLQKIMAELGANPGDVTKFQVEGGYVYRMKDSILFGFASSDVSPEGRKILAEVAKDINSRPHGTVYVRGHTDAIPVARPETLKKFPHGNLQLSAARAIEVAALLTKQSGVPADRVVVMGFGPNQPVASNATDDGRQKNRRVEIFVSDEEGGD